MIKLRFFIFRYKDIIESIIVSIVSIVGLVFGVVPAIHTVVASWNQIQVLGKELPALETKAAHLESLDETALRAQIQIVNSALPTDRAIPSAFATINQLAAVSGVTVLSTTLTNVGTVATGSAARQSDQERKLGVPLVPLSVSIQGTLEQVERFLLNATSVSRLVQVQSYSLGFPETGGVSMALDMLVFYHPANTSIGSVRDPLPIITKEEEEAIAKVSSYPLLYQSGGQAGTSLPQGKINPFARE